MPHVAVSIVAWNSMKYLPEALASIEAQTFKDLSVIVVDNASSDGVAEYVRGEHPRAMVIRNTQNLGFARGHNQAIAYARAQLARPGEELYVLVTNPDIILEPDHVATLVDAIERRPEVGSATGKLLKVRERGEGELREPERTDLLDTTGIRIHRSRKFTERGAGEKDGAYERTEEVFGASGALALYRVDALADVAHGLPGPPAGRAGRQAGQEYFDEDFFVYKEDVDLAWRLRLRGWASLYVPRARAYHYRTAAGAERASLGDILRGRRGRSDVVNFFSYRNHLMLLAKNEHLRNALADLPRIWWFETRKFLYLLCFEPATLRAWPSFIRNLPRMARKRRQVLGRATVGPKELRKWFV